MVTDLQSAWLILWHCAHARANCLLRVVEPQSVAAYTRAHDESVWICMCALLNINITWEKDIRSCANFRWCWAEWEERHTDKCLGILGKLGKLFAHDVRQTP